MQTKIEITYHKDKDMQVENLLTALKEGPLGLEESHLSFFLSTGTTFPPTRNIINEYDILIVLKKARKKRQR